jgi:hypothetical protein
MPDLDLSTEKLETGSVVNSEEYDSRPQEDSARRRIAYYLLTMLAGVILWAALFTWINPEELDAVKGLLELVLGPLVALVSAATGFYFGSKSK